MSDRTQEKTTLARANRGRIYGAGAIALVVLIAAFQLRPRPAASQQRVRQATMPAGSQPSASLSTDANSTSAAAKPGGPEGDRSAGIGPLTVIGTVQADQTTLSVVQPARIVGVSVREGDRVRRGQALVRLDAAAGQAQERTAAAGVAGARAQLAKAKAGREAQRVKADADVGTARAGLRQAQDKLKQATLAREATQAAQQADLVAAQENVRKARLGLERAQTTLHSLEQLDAVGGVARNDLEGARTQVASAQSDLDQAEAQVRRLQAGPPGGTSFRVALAGQDMAAAQAGVQQAGEGVDTALRARQETLRLAQQDIVAAAAGVRQAEAGLYGAQSATQLSLLTSPLDGIVGAINAHNGEIAQPGSPLLTIVAQADYRVEALVTARELPRLRLGQAAHITLDTRPDQVYMASLYAISRVAEPDGRSFRIKLRFLHPPADPRLNQTTRITFASH